MKTLTKAMFFTFLAVFTVGFIFTAFNKSEPDPPPVEIEIPPPPPPPPETEVYVFPYSGLTTTNPALINKKPFMVKIENSSAARPQKGLNRADVVYETHVEGNESRFNCIFQSDIPDEVGPVRSARLSDLWVVPQYHGMLFYSGANRQVIARLYMDEINIMSWDAAPALYHRVDSRYAPHNLYLDLTGGYKQAKKNGLKTRSKRITPLFFGQTTQCAITTSESIDAHSGAPVTTLSAFNSKPVTSVTVPFGSPAKWRWDEEKEVFLRWTGGEKHFDDETNEQLWCDNVVIMWADYIQQPTLDPAGSPTYDTDLGGSGDAIIFRDGVMIKCIWNATRTTVPKFTAVDSLAEVPLKAGRTWVIVPRTGLKLQIKHPKPPEPTTAAVDG